MKFNLVYGNLTKSEESAAKTMHHKYKLNDTGFAGDLFNLVKTGGLKLYSESACLKLIRDFERKHGADIADAVEERYAFFMALGAIPLFAKLCNMVKTHSVEEAVDRLLSLLRAAYRKQQQSTCCTCQHFKNCAYGKVVVGDESPNANAKPHADCPMFKPSQASNISPTQQLTSGANMVAAVLNPAMIGLTNVNSAFIKMLVAAGAGQGYSHDKDYFDASFTGDKIMAQLENIVDALTREELVVFNLARTFDHHIEATNQKKLQKSPTPDQLNPSQLENIEDFTKSTPTEQALPDVLRNYRIATKQTNIVEHHTPDGKKQLLYVLVDSSGSMTLPVSPNMYAFVRRGDVATALTLAVIKKALVDGSMLFLRFFAGGVDILHRCKDAQDFAHLSRKVSLGSYDGGSTCIKTALETAFSDIDGAKDEVRKSEVLLISDAEDSFDVGPLQTAKKGAKLHTLEITNGNNSSGKSRSALTQLSDTYIEVDPATVDLEKIASVVPE